jgi:hypothetical protein
MPAWATGDWDNVNPLDLHDEEFYINQNESIRIYNQLLEGFATDSATFSADSQMPYPDYYGGAYIDDETGQLVVLVTDSDVAIENAISMYAREVQGICYELCDVSYKDMLTAISEITNRIEEFSKQGIDITCVADNIMNGTVLVGVKDLTNEKKDFILNATNYDFLVFEENEGVIANAGIGGGNKVVGSNNRSSTICFAATTNTSSGFVIAGHVGSVRGDDFTYNGNKIGMVLQTAFYNNSTADAAFLKAASNVETSYILANGGHLWAASTYKLPVNTTVWKYGITTGLTSGQIHTTGASGTVYKYDANGNVVSSAVITDQYWVNLKGEPGDSGAPVMVYDGNYNGSTKYTLVGIYSGTNRYGSVFSGYANIVKELGVTCITE